MKRYGESAATEAAMRADEFLDQGNMEGKRVWMRIMQAIEELQRERAGDGEAVHRRVSLSAPFGQLSGSGVARSDVRLLALSGRHGRHRELSEPQPETGPRNEGPP